MLSSFTPFSFSMRATLAELRPSVTESCGSIPLIDLGEVLIVCVVVRPFEVTLLENNDDLDGIPVARSLLVDIMSVLLLPLMVEQDWVERSLLVVKLLKSMFMVLPLMPARPESPFFANVGWPRSEVADFSFLS